MLKTVFFQLRVFCQCSIHLKKDLVKLNKELLISNIEKYCAARNTKPTPAAMAAGVGHTFLTDIKRGKIPSVEKVATLAAYLGVSTSDLVGDAQTPADLAPLADAWAELNDEGRERLIAYAEDLTASGRYIKNHQSQMEA